MVPSWLTVTPVREGKHERFNLFVDTITHTAVQFCLQLVMQDKV